MFTRHRSVLPTMLVAIVAALLSACGGSKVLKSPVPFELQEPLAKQSAADLNVTLDWVIVRDGPGTWARRADWDEYLLRVSNNSSHPITITNIRVVDSLGTSVAPEVERKALVKASRKSARRYKKEGIRVRAGKGAGTLVATGLGVTALGVSASMAAGYASLSTAGASSAGAAGSAAGGLVLLGPVLAVRGIVRGVNNRKVHKAIGDRQAQLPYEVAANREEKLHVFFPLAPSPQAVEIHYLSSSGEQLMLVDTTDALAGLHFSDKK